MSQGFIAVIPARYASSRLPGKPLLDIGGKPMLQWVHEATLQSGADAVVIATDDARIEAAATAFGADVCMTSATHSSGTERLAEVVERRGIDDDTIVVNVQGDEPLIPPALVRQVAEDLGRHSLARIATLVAPLTDADAFFDPNVVKVAIDREGYALYFSRAPIPWDRELLRDGRRALSALAAPWRHIGIYAYRAGYLRGYADMAAAPLEQAEQLEQLRALWHGEKIHVAEAVVRPGPGVDTQADLDAVRALLTAGRRH